MNEMNEMQATDEALLLTIRKLGRLHPEAYADVMKRLPDGARWALSMAENRADRLRDQVGGPANLEWPTMEEESDEEE